MKALSREKLLYLINEVYADQQTFLAMDFDKFLAIHGENVDIAVRDGHLIKQGVVVNVKKRHEKKDNSDSGRA
jgi:hypothetical protein